MSAISKTSLPPSPINLAALEKIKSWTRDTNDKGDYMPGSETRRYDGKLRPGAYVIEAKAGSLSVRDLILVTDAALVLKTSGKQALVYFCSALNSAPIANGKVKLWERWHDGKTWQAKQTEKPLNNEGIAVFDLSRSANNSLELFASAIRSRSLQVHRRQNRWRNHSPAD